MEKSRWTLAELAEETGVPARTIRYYISRNLIAGPEVSGRGAVYGVQHRDRLIAIRALQSEGKMLADIASPQPASAKLPYSQPWQHYVIADDVVVQVRADAAPWRLKRIHRLVAEMSAQLSEEETDHGDGQY